MQNQSDRRNFIKNASATALAIGAASSVAFSEDKKSAGVSADEALKRLVEGNNRFVEGKNKVRHLTGKQLAKLEEGQHPFATIIGCSDSRVPIEMLFDQGFGDIFTIRLAGNIIDDDVEGSVEYGYLHTGTKLVMVMGHEGCGAVTAALATKEDQEKEPYAIRQLVNRINPVLKDIDPKLPKAERLKIAVEANVRQSINQILAFKDHKKAHDAGLFKLVGAVYDLHTGKVRILK